MWYRRYCTARKAREGTHKVDHHDSHCTQDEAYHTASQASFRRTTWQQKLNYAVVLFESLDNFEKWQLLGWARRHYMHILRYNCPSSSRWTQNPHLVRHSKLDNFSRTIRPVEVAAPAMLRMVISQLHGDISMLQYTEVFSLFSSSCIIMEMCSG